MWVAIFYGVISAAALGFAALSLSERSARVISSGILGISCLLSNASAGTSELLWPVMDSLLGAFFILWWLDAPNMWKIRLFALFMMQSACHVVYYAALAFGLDVGYCYTAALNALFVCQLYVVSSDGIRRGRDHVGSWSADILSGARAYGAVIFARKAR